MDTGAQGRTWGGTAAQAQEDRAECDALPGRLVTQKALKIPCRALEMSLPVVHRRHLEGFVSVLALLVLELAVGPILAPPELLIDLQMPRIPRGHPPHLPAPLASSTLHPLHPCHSLHSTSFMLHSFTAPVPIVTPGPPLYLADIVALLHSRLLLLLPVAIGLYRAELGMAGAKHAWWRGSCKTCIVAWIMDIDCGVARAQMHCCRSEQGALQ